MRVSEIQRRRSQPTEQPIPARRAVLWVAIALGIGVGIYLYFRFAPAVTAVLEY